MKYLLIGGAPNTGKTSAINRLARTLVTAPFGFTILVGTIPPRPPLGVKEIDFRVILEGYDDLGKKICILINSATDDKYNIDMLKELYDHNPVDMIVTSTRDIRWERDYLFTTMGINSGDFVVEIPMGKITRRIDFSLAVSWYEAKIDALAIHALHNRPFNI